MKKIKLQKILRHKRVIAQMVEDGCNLSNAARKHGYSEAYIRSGKLQKTKSWQESQETALNDDKLLQIHQEGLRAFRLCNGKKIPDFQARHKYLVTAYDIKNRFIPTVTVKNELSRMSDEELEKQLVETIAHIISSFSKEDIAAIQSAR